MIHKEYRSINVCFQRNFFQKHTVPKLNFPILYAPPFYILFFSVPTLILVLEFTVRLYDRSGLRKKKWIHSL